MSDISSSTMVHVVGIAPDGHREYLVKPELHRNAKQELELWPIWSKEPRDSRSMNYEMAQLFQQRMRREHGTVIHFTLSAGADQFIQTREPSDRMDFGNRPNMAYKGLLAVPGYDVRNQKPVYYVRFPKSNIESVRGDTVEEAVDKVFERNLQQYAEKAPAMPPPEPPKVDVPYTGPRLRPGDIR
jgi:hypothetical protein